MTNLNIFHYILAHPHIKFLTHLKLSNSLSNGNLRYSSQNLAACSINWFYLFIIYGIKFTIKRIKMERLCNFIISVKIVDYFTDYRTFNFHLNCSNYCLPFVQALVQKVFKWYLQTFWRFKHFLCYFAFLDRRNAIFK